MPMPKESEEEMQQIVRANILAAQSQPPQSGTGSEPTRVGSQGSTRGGFQPPSAPTRGGYPPSAPTRGGFQPPSAPTRGGFQPPSAPTRGGYPPQTSTRGGFQPPSAPTRGGFQPPSAPNRGGYPPQTSTRGGFQPPPPPFDYGTYTGSVGTAMPPQRPPYGGAYGQESSFQLEQNAQNPNPSGISGPAGSGYTGPPQSQAPWVPPSQRYSQQTRSRHPGLCWPGCGC